MLFLGGLEGHDEGQVLLLAIGFLQNGVDVDAMAAQDGAHAPQDAGPVAHHEPQIGGDDVLIGRGNSRRMPVFVSEGGRARAARDNRARDLDDVGKHRDAGGFTSRAAAGDAGVAALVAHQQYAVGGALHARQARGGGDHHGTDEDFQAIAGAAPRSGDQAQRVVQPVRVGKIHLLDARDAFHGDVANPHRLAKTHHGQDGDLVAGIVAFNVEGGVGLGVSFFLSLGQDFGE